MGRKLDLLGQFENRVNSRDTRKTLEKRKKTEETDGNQ